MQVSDTVRVAQAYLDDKNKKHCVVIGLQSTGEAAMDKEVAKVSDWAPSNRLVHSNYLSNTLGQWVLTQVSTLLCAPMLFCLLPTVVYLPCL